MRARSLLFVVPLALALVTGCDRFKKSGSSESGSSTGEATRTAFDLSVGESGYTLTPGGSGYTIAAKSGAGGTVKIESDRVKVAAGAEAKVKKKDDGFKVYDASDAVVLEGKRRDGGWKIKRGDESELGRLDDGGGTLGGAKVEVRRDGDHWVVARGGANVGQASASLSAGAASMLALTELSPEQRIALVVYRKELEP